MGHMLQHRVRGRLHDALCMCEVERYLSERACMEGRSRFEC